MRAQVLVVWSALALLLGGGAARAQVERDPHLGYVYPAGGRQASSFRVACGGEFLRGVDSVVVSGQGVTGKVVEWARPLDKKELGDAARYIGEAYRNKVAEAMGRPAPKAEPLKDAKGEDIPPLPDHPWLRNLDKLSLKDLDALRARLYDPKRQMNAQLGEMVLLDVAIAANAAPGDREIRLLTPTGVTNPLCFQVGVVPEVNRSVAGDFRDNPTKVDDLPLVYNGYVLPGARNRFHFNAKKGQQLVFDAQARRLIPYLADAVPGWFQASLALFDSQGRELAFTDHWRFDPDPVLLYTAPADGVYGVEIRDSIYRGREDFVYRLAVGELPFVTDAWPLGGRLGATCVAEIDGSNLPGKHLLFDTGPLGGAVRHAPVRFGQWLPSSVAYAVDTLPEVDETEPNDTPDKAQAVAWDTTVNGRIDRPGDRDTYCLDANIGDVLVAEVTARRVDSALDSLLRLTDAKGKVLAWNDDFDDPEFGLLTHHADSYLRTTLERPGRYFITISDTQQHGGPAYGYRLRLGRPRPDFAVRITPSGLNLAPGRTVEVVAHAVRKDGFDGDIFVLLHGTNKDFYLSGGRIPPGRDSVRMTLTATQQGAAPLTPLQVDSRALIGGRFVVHPAVPAEDMMQAFLYRHLVPTQAFMVAVNGKGRGLPLWPGTDRPLSVPAGGTVQIPIQGGRGAGLAGYRFELKDPPKGLSLVDSVPIVVPPKPTPRDPKGLLSTLFVTLKADAALKSGFAENLILTVSVEPPQAAGADPKKRPNRWAAGVLPAMPFEVTAATTK